VEFKRESPGQECRATSADYGSATAVSRERSAHLEPKLPSGRLNPGEFSPLQSGLSHGLQGGLRNQPPASLALVRLEGRAVLSRCANRF